MYTPNFYFLAQFGGEIGEEQHFYKVKKLGNPRVSTPNRLKGLIFYIFYNFWSSIDWLKKGQILYFGPLSTPSAKLSITEFWVKFIFTHICLICSQTELIDWIVVILVGIKQSKWFQGSEKKMIKEMKNKNKYLAWLKTI